MSEQMALVSSGQITNAVRDTNIDGVEIKKDDFMGTTQIGRASCRERV